MMYAHHCLETNPSLFARKKNYLPFSIMLAGGIAGVLLFGAAQARAAITHRWSFTETNGPILDSIGSSNGTVVVLGGNSLRTNGLFRMAGGARATTDYVQLPSGLVHNLTNVTVELWATPRAGQTWSRVFDFGPGNNTQAGTFFLSFCQGSTSLNQQRFEYGAPVVWTVNTALTTTVSNQYHYVVTWSATGGPSGGGLAQWYRDGILQASTDTGASTISNVNDTVLWLGRSQYTGDNSASADYNELRLYSHAMSPTEINISRLNGPDNFVLPPPPASNLTLTTNSSSGVLILSWTPGAGSAGSLVVMRAAQAPTGQPTNGITYTASASFGSGQDLGNSNYVVYSNSGNSVTVSNLVPGVQYYAAVYSYSGSGVSTLYNLGDAPTGNRIAPGIVQSISLQVSPQIVIYGGSQATVTANYGGGIFTDVTGSAGYSSSNTNAVTVSASGALQAPGYGSAVITATYQGRQDSNTVAVVNPLTNNLTHRYSFTADASDSVGTAHGSLGGAASIASGQVVLDGASGFVNLPNNLVTGYTSITLEAWVTDNGSAAWARIFDLGNNTGGEDAQGTGTQYMFLSLPAGAGNLRGAYTVNAPGNEQVLEWAGNRPAAGQKSHIVWTTDGATHTGKLYVNGVPVATNLNMTVTPAAIGPTANNWLGKSQFAADPYFNGLLDEFRIYNVALPFNIILTNFLSGPDGIPTAPPVAVNDTMTLNPGAMALIPILQNDLGPQLDPASIAILSGPSAGTARVKPGGKVLYTHNGGPATLDQFTYTVQNSFGATSGVATVSITITNALRLPNTTITIPNIPPPVGYQVVDAFPGLSIMQPLALQSLPGATYTNKLFIVERRGYISYLPDITATTPVRQILLDITNQVSYDNSATDGERGLLGLAFHPGFATNGFFFVFYTGSGGNPYTERLVRFTANPTNLTVDTNTQLVLWNTTKREFNHNGGDLHFGLDGYLYVSMGDEGGQYNVHTNAQRLDGSLYSGILRLDVDKRPGNLEPNPPGPTIPILTIPTDGSGHAFYGIPADNPFLGVTNLYGTPVDTNHLRGEFYAIGFRHPWRFSIDPSTGEIWVGHVGQDLYESVDLLRKGGNYGWPYYEGIHLTSTNYPTQPTMFPPPAGFVPDPPLYEYNHSGVPGTDPQFAGLDVNGSLVYHGSHIPQLTNAYVFGDFDLGGNIWALRRTNNTVTVERLTGQYGECAFAADPNNGDVLMCNYIQNKIHRLVTADTANSTYPAKLSDTGVFADLATLTPNPGIVNYEPIVAFWSDYAIKRRWFCIPDTTNRMNYATDANWTFPNGMMWIKHFDLELTRGNPATKKRIETRVLFKTTNGVYGVSYKWNDTDTEAFLAPDAGTNFNVNVLVGSTPITQQWEIPSRSSCLACHTVVAGHALSFNTRELNQTTNMNTFSGNQLALLSQAGYLNTSVAAPQTLPSFANANDSTRSLESRVRSYLSENCVQCHQPGGSGAQTWDARPWLTLDQTHLINGVPDNNGGNPLNKLIVPGDTNHSVVLQRILGNGFTRMPPLATHQLDPGAINLLTTWIGGDLTNRQSFADWQIAHFGSTSNPAAAAAADPDNDGASNYFEYLTQTDPLNPLDVWKLGINVSGGFVNVSYPQVPNLGVVIDASTDLFGWAPWNIPGNQPIFGSSAGTALLQTPFTPDLPAQYFRARLIEP